ncbi:TY4B-J, partial [Symbiodinium sp. CCMP2456]
MEFPAEDRDHQEGYLLKDQSKELHYHKETDAVKQGIDNARLKEWGNWQGFEAVDIILPEDVPAYLKEHKDAEITPTRWVDNNKAQPWEDPRYKSRIVVRGDLETGAEGARTDSPTASSMMFNLLLSITANKRWRLRGGDITASFLQGDVITRTLILRPPPGGLPGVPEGALLRARKPVYGTKDAPRGFWKRLHRVALSKGLRAIPGEHAAYVLQDKHHGLQGIVIAHVDDLLWSGSEAMDKVMDEIIKEFKFGALEFGDKFDYCGRTVEQGKDGITITVPNNAAKLRPIHLGAERRRQKDHYVTEQERAQLRSIVGSLNWLVRVCRVDIAYEVHRLQAVMQKAMVEDLIMCNQILNYVKKTPNKG